MMSDLIARLLSQFLRELSYGRELGIKDLAASGTNDMGVWVWLIAILTVASMGKIKLQDLAHIF